jgi:hypothetical protein
MKTGMGVISLSRKETGGAGVQLLNRTTTACRSYTPLRQRDSVPIIGEGAQRRFAYESGNVRAQHVT